MQIKNEVGLVMARRRRPSSSLWNDNIVLVLSLYEGVETEKDSDRIWAVRNVTKRDQRKFFFFLFHRKVFAFFIASAAVDTFFFWGRKEMFLRRNFGGLFFLFHHEALQFHNKIDGHRSRKLPNTGTCTASTGLRFHQLFGDVSLILTYC